MIPCLEQEGLELSIFFHLCLDGADFHLELLLLKIGTQKPVSEDFSVAYIQLTTSGNS